MTREPPMRRLALSALGSLALASLAACGEKPAGDKAAADADNAAAASGTLASAVSGAAGMTTVAGALKSSGLASVFDGNAPYTLLAPDDDAFGALGDAGAALKTPENSAAMAAVLRAHVLPGFVTRADIDSALAAAKGKPVKMKTMAGDEVTFARAGDTVSVTAADGSTAKLDGNQIAASNGVALPIDAVLKKVPGATPSG
jgi:uncharacterized surface protein with fasciclin (FAS1) repeats